MQMLQSEWVSLSHTISVLFVLFVAAGHVRNSEISRSLEFSGVHLETEGRWFYFQEGSQNDIHGFWTFQLVPKWPASEVENSNKNSVLAISLTYLMPEV